MKTALRSLQLLREGRITEAEEAIAVDILENVIRVERGQMTFRAFRDILEVLHDYIVVSSDYVAYSGWVYEAIHEVDVYQTCLQAHHHDDSKEAGGCMDVGRIKELALRR